jgi:hypothetical protein
MTRLCVSRVNTIKTFLLSIQQMKKPHPFNCVVRSIVCSYLSAFPYHLIKLFIGNSPEVLKTRCCLKKHVCTHCIKLKNVQQQLDELRSRPIPLPVNMRNEFRLAIRTERLLNDETCTKDDAEQCANCLQFDDRRLWYKTIREHAKVYGNIKVI